MSNKRTLTRRSVVRTIAASGFTLGTVGTGRVTDRSMADAEAVYIVLAGGGGLRNRLERAGYSVLQEFAGGSLYLTQGPEDSERALRSLPTVTDAVANQPFEVSDLEQAPAESVAERTSLSEQQWDKHRTNTFAAHDIATGDGTTLAVVDTGISGAHPDLASGVDTARGRLFRNGHSHAGEMSVQIRPSGELGSETAELPAGTDIDGHGTHVAGVAAGRRRDRGIVGTAPDATVVPLRTMFYRELSDTFSVTHTTVADTLLALDYAVEIGADVVTVSLGVGPLSPSVTRRRLFAAFGRVIQHAIENGTVVVAAGGNQGLNFEEASTYDLPSTNRGVISVAATGPNDRRRYDSNYGDGVIDVAAPGGGYDTRASTAHADRSEWGVLSSVPADIYGKQYGYTAGTSMAAPQVAGLACLVRELAPDLHPRRVKQVIETGAVDLSGPNTAGLGAGRIDVAETVRRVSEQV